MWTVWNAVARRARQVLEDLNQAWLRGRLPVAAPLAAPSGGPRKYEPLTRVLLTDEVSRTLFDEYAVHRKSERGQEETGWVLLGLRDTAEAIVLATLPAGAESQAGVAHVQFNSSAQALASRIVRQVDRRLVILGIVHTHPGSLRHPSDGDFRGDSVWVEQLRSGEGIFGIGTADGDPEDDGLYARQPRPHIQTLGPLCLSWYALGRGDHGYRPLPYGITLGPDLARPLHSIWTTIEQHGDRLDRLCRQQAGVRFEIVPGQRGGALAVQVPLAEPGNTVRVLIEGDDVRYYWMRDGALLSSEAREARVDRGVYLVLAELAAQS